MDIESSPEYVFGSEHSFQAEIKLQIELCNKIELSLKHARLIDEGMHLDLHSKLLEAVLKSLEKLKGNIFFHLNFHTNQVLENF